MSYLATLSDLRTKHAEDDVDALPAYPRSVGGGSNRGHGEEDEGDEAPLIGKDKGKGVEGGPVAVDGFGYQLGRVHHDLSTLRSNLSGIASLHADALALAPPDTSLVAQSFLQDLSAQTAATAELLSTVPSELRSLASKVNVLKPAAGKFVVSAAEQNAAKTELADCAELLRSSVRDVETGARKELDEKPQARIRLLKVIKAREEGADEATQMGMLLSAEREGQWHAEQLKPNSYGWRWSVEHPYTRLQAALHSSGDLSFLASIQAPSAPAPSLWASPLSYLPSLRSTSRPPLYSSPSAASTFTADDSAPSLSSSTPLYDIPEEDKVGSYGEPLSERRTMSPGQGPKRWKVALGLFVLLAAMGGAAVGVVLWGRKVDGESETSGTSEAATAAPGAVHVGSLGQ
ncbi:hypothetical protein JCM8097_003311 [Rhodosporidiobolus ruineniae]